MIDTLPEKAERKQEPFAIALERRLDGVSPELSWLSQRRREWMQRFVSLGWPTPKDEDWRFTNLAALREFEFVEAEDPSRRGVQAVLPDSFLFGEVTGPLMVFVNGFYSPELSHTPSMPEGVQFGSLSEALRPEDESLESYLGQFIQETDRFGNLNGALFQDGVRLVVSPNQTVSEPLRIVYLTTDIEAGAAMHPRNLFVVGRGSQVSVLEYYVGPMETPYFVNAATEVVLEEGANLEHIKVQEEGLEAFHIASVNSRLAKDSRLRFHSLALGARLARNNIHTRLEGTGVECVLNGLYLTRGKQLSDHHMVVEHVEPHCESHEYFNGILDDQSRGVFHGRIHVHQKAQKTDAKQTNRNLLLSDQATANSKPQLEIYADDVRCTHGATIGQMDKEAIFYLRTRGIGEATARRLLMHAFAGEIIDRIQCQPVRETLDQVVWDRLERLPLVAVGESVKPAELVSAAPRGGLP